MSQLQRPRTLPGRSAPTMLYQLPEMVSSLRKDVYFFQPEETVSLQEFEVLGIQRFLVIHFIISGKGKASEKNERRAYSK